MKDNPRPPKGGRYVLDEATNRLVPAPDPSAATPPEVPAPAETPAKTPTETPAETSDETPAADSPRRSRTQRG